MTNFVRIRAILLYYIIIILISIMMMMVRKLTSGTEIKIFARYYQSLWFFQTMVVNYNNKKIG